MWISSSTSSTYYSPSARQQEKIHTTDGRISPTENQRRTLCQGLARYRDDAATAGRRLDAFGDIAEEAAAPGHSASVAAREDIRTAVSKAVDKDARLVRGGDEPTRRPCAGPPHERHPTFARGDGLGHGACFVPLPGRDRDPNLRPCDRRRMVCRSYDAGHQRADRP